jgi:hypothetical protein
MSNLFGWRLAAPALIVVAGWMLTGCGQDVYTLRGQVVRGPVGQVVVVDADDPRLAGPAIEQAVLRFTLDPRSLGREPLGSTYSTTDGSFAIPINIFGAGSLLHEVGLSARAAKFSPTRGVFILPGRGKRLLVTMTPGMDIPDPTEPTPEQLRDRYWR